MNIPLCSLFSTVYWKLQRKEENGTNNLKTNKSWLSWIIHCISREWTVDGFLEYIYSYTLWMKFGWWFVCILGYFFWYGAKGLFPESRSQVRNPKRLPVWEKFNRLYQNLVQCLFLWSAMPLCPELIKFYLYTFDYGMFSNGCLEVVVTFVDSGTWNETEKNRLIMHK